MADDVAAPAGTSSTPPVAAAASTTVADTAAPTTDASPATTAPSTDSPAVSTAPVIAAPATDGSAPLFTLPDDVKLAPEATSKFESFLKGKLSTEGKVVMTSQEVVDQFLEQGRDANARWHKQIQDTDKANEAVCKERFTPAQLSAAETAIGFAASYDPAFRDFAKRQLNDPVFVNFMRNIGERLSEDTFEIAGSPPPPQNKKSAADRLYPGGFKGSASKTN
jgi:hypothetical protein